MSAQEGRVSSALRIDPELSGFRQIEVASGLCDDTLLKVIPQTGFSSGLLTCRTRGVFTWEAGDRRPLSLEHRSSAGHHDHSLSQRLKTIKSEGSVGQEHRGVRPMTDFLDPSLDIWANTPEGLGDAGWALAVIAEMEAVTLTLEDLGRILRLGERQVRRVVQKLRGVKSRSNRRVLVTFDFSWMTHEDLADTYLKRSRAARKARSHQEEAGAVKAMVTRVGRQAKELWKNRIAEVRQLREYLDQIPELAKVRHRLELLIRALSPQQPRRWSGERQIRQYLTTYQEFA